MSPKLQPGDEIRIVAPSGGWQAKRLLSYERAKQRLEDLGYKVTYGKNIQSVERFHTGALTARVGDLHDAYRDPNVCLIVALHGGWCANALLRCIDWDLVSANPKPLLGFSDITVLVNALYARTGAVQYLGPTYASLGSKHLLDYTIDNLASVLQGTAPLELRRSTHWQRKHGANPSKTRPWKVLQEGSGEGVVIGGNLGTFYLLQGTPYQPRFDRPTILAVEDDDEAGKYSAREFMRRLESILQLPGVPDNLRGLLIGRFQPSSKVTLPDVRYVVEQIDLPGIPVVADVDFGHTSPMLTLPIGGTASVRTHANQVQLSLLKY